MSTLTQAAPSGAVQLARTVVKSWKAPIALAVFAVLRDDATPIDLVVELLGELGERGWLLSV